jgi:hypothetical protein
LISLLMGRLEETHHDLSEFLIFLLSLRHVDKLLQYPINAQIGSIVICW